ncbi:MAG: hypothetical protein HOW73_07130 [Polyangiaceae bacterium]|nr:hypothetical protein [Polyangiaceae bacterium]
MRRFTAPAGAEVTQISSKRSALVADVTLAACIALLYRVLLTVGNGTMLAGYDLVQQLHWVHGFVGGELRAGRLPLHDPYTLGGASLTNPQVALFYPPTWLHALLSPARAHAWFVLGHLAVAAIVVRRLLTHEGITSRVAWAAGLTWSVTGFVAARAQEGHLSILAAATWLPVVVGGTWSFVRTKQLRDLVLGGVGVGAMLLAGDPQLLLYALLASLVGAACRAKQVALRPAVVDPVVACAGALAIGCALGAAALVATMSFAAGSDNADPSYELSTLISTDLRSIVVGLVLPDDGADQIFIDGGSTGFDVQNERACAIGAPLVALGVARLARRSRDFDALAMLMLGVFLSLGSSSVYRVLLEVVPGLRLFRAPARAVVLVAFALVILGAREASELERSLASRAHAAGFGVAALLALGAAVVCFAVPVLFNVDTHRPGGVFERVGIASHLFLTPTLGFAAAAGALALARTGRATFAPVGAFVVAVYAVLTARPLSVIDDDVARGASARAAELRDELAPTNGAVRVDLPAEMLGAANATIDARVENVNGYAGRRPAPLMRLLSGFEPPPGPANAHHLPPSHYATPGMTQRTDLRLLGVTSTVKLHKGRYELVRVDDPLPRAWLVPSWEVVEDAVAIERIGDPTFDPRETALLASPLEASPGAVDGKIHARREPDASLLVEVETSRAGLLVVSEPPLPGTNVFVDDIRVPWARADLALLAVSVPEGRHRVRVEHRPRAVLAGAIVSAAAWVGLALLSLRARLRAKQVRATP